MITIKSNIEFLNNRFNFWNGLTVAQPTVQEIKDNLQYAIETLKMIDQLKDDVWDEKRADIIGQNSNEGLHYE